MSSKSNRWGWNLLELLTTAAWLKAEQIMETSLTRDTECNCQLLPNLFSTKTVCLLGPSCVRVEPAGATEAVSGVSQHLHLWLYGSGC